MCSYCVVLIRHIYSKRLYFVKDSSPNRGYLFGLFAMARLEGERQNRLGSRLALRESCIHLCISVNVTDHH